MTKLALYLAMVLCFSYIIPFAVSADEIIGVEYEVLDEQPPRTTGQDCYEVLNNRSFEILDSETALNSWGFTSPKGGKNTYLGDEFSARSTDAHSGEYSLKVTAPEGKYLDTLYGATVKAGEVYEFSVWHKKVIDGNTGYVHILFEGKNKGIAQTYDRVKMSLGKIEVKDGWVKRAVRFTAPEYATQASICLRFSGPGEVLWDDASLLCITDEMPKPDMPDAKSSLKDIPVINGDFEDPAGTGWELHGLSHITDEEAHSGTHSLALHTEGGSADGEAIATFTGFEKGATYQISAWVLTPSDTSVDFGFWLHYSSKEEYDWINVDTQIGTDKSARWGLRQDMHWRQVRGEFTPPDGTKSILIDLRHRLTPGLLYLDDLQIYMVKPPYALNADTDEVFYYTEWPTGKLSGTPYVMADPTTTKAEISFVELDGTETHKETITGLTQDVEYVFRTEWMKEKGQRYHIRLKVTDAAGAVMQEQDFPVFRFDRPTYLGADGVFRKNGDEITFTFGPGVKRFDMPGGVQHNLLEMGPEKGGVTVVQLLGDETGLSLGEKMDLAYERGLYVIVNLYSGSKGAGHPDMIDQTIRTVTNMKDHPALFAYKLHDEPLQKGTSDEEMILAYSTIRNIDPNHPVYFPDSVPGGYEWMYKYCDILDIDYYGGSNPDAGRIISNIMDQGFEASKGRKPLSIVLQAFPMNGYLPTVDELRHHTYQAFFSGVAGYTLHSLGVDGTEDPTPYMTRPDWQEIVDGWAKWERDFMYGCFVTGEYTYVNYQKTDNVLWGTYTDGTDLYTIVLNRQKEASTDVTIPLTDGAGTMQVGSYVAQTMTGEKKRLTGEGSLSITLSPMEAVVWKITPTGSSLNASHLKTSKFRDLLSYPWAYNAIASLEEKGIVNKVSDTWYGPGQNITRGDYAMFLVRALGLTSAAGENFADVDPKAEYAKELAIGKAAGIINGVGDNKFNPEAQITRQDMMTMTSRAMALAGAADLSAFSDSGMIADYAAQHVSAMVAEGLIKGNADGTINPLGNTTRAEAAVIMNRIINK